MIFFFFFSYFFCTIILFFSFLVKPNKDIVPRLCVHRGEDLAAQIPFDTISHLRNPRPGTETIVVGGMPDLRTSVNVTTSHGGQPFESECNCVLIKGSETLQRTDEPVISKVTFKGPEGEDHPALQVCVSPEKYSLLKHIVAM